MSKRLFGTDGIRSVAGQAPLDPPTVRRFGLALARRLIREPGAARVVL
ncbi:MAG: phosphoglucosamine mutase, partial [Acidobacteria bacterium]|nr:phosphoglucosamine mutase [Acidobacteriota bacterium]NIM62262.1 phosphoglucosamine mutase [Acidobacteriota bacterium]NIO58668.1 phosphoglucosamine mutase [Acidobacteriota bacterium]NIQ29724.1 phosphoglucosamine mutase [Acidobacteriota bacterium]NIQ84448.1 phosphoglucosamine mutase [Acidobacteriota bacterium]